MYPYGKSLTGLDLGCKYPRKYFVVACHLSHYMYRMQWHLSLFLTLSVPQISELDLN